MTLDDLKRFPDETILECCGRGMVEGHDIMFLKKGDALHVIESRMSSYWDDTGFKPVWEIGTELRLNGGEDDFIEWINHGIKGE